MNNLNNLKLLLEKLTKKELSLLERSLSNAFNENNPITKSIDLLKLLRDKSGVTSNEIQINLYGKVNYYAFNKLINRLKEKAQDVIIMESSIKSNSFSKRNFILINLRKKLLQADILQLKGDRTIVAPMYEHVGKFSKKFEFYDLLVQSLSSKQRLQSININSTKYKKISEEIEHAEKCLVSLKDSTIIYREIANVIGNSVENKDYYDSLIKSIERIRTHYEITKSPSIGFYLFTLETELYQINQEYLKAHASLEKLKNILIKNESAYTTNRYGVVILNLANNNIYLECYDEAIKLANESKEYFRNVPLTLKIVDEMLFYCYFYTHDYRSCKAILTNNLKFDDNNLKSKFEYFKACYSFVNNEFEKSLSELKNSLEMEKDNEGWNINKRILTIMNWIELKDYELVDLQIQNLDKFIKRVSKNKIVSNRYLIILRILSSLLRENLNFDLVYAKKKKYFELLISNNGSYSWVIKSPELINFTSWFKGKMSKIN